MKSIIRAAGGVAAALTVSSQALAGTANANLTVNATILSLCSATDATLSFGNINPVTGVTTPVTSTINVTCTLGSAFSVGLGAGGNHSGGSRRMKRQGSNDYVAYDLFIDVLLTPFGDTDANDRAEGVGLGIAPTPVPVLGTIPAGQNAPAGDYADTVQITVYY